MVFSFPSCDEDFQSGCVVSHQAFGVGCNLANYTLREQ